MTRAFKALFVLLSLTLATGVSAEESNEAKDSHGTFTGEMKPVLYVSDVEKSAPFYRDILGFDFEGFAGPDSNPYYAEMTTAGIKFGLHEPMSAREEGKVGQLRLYFRVENLEAHRARVLAWGGEAGKIKNTDWMDMFIVRESDGNEVVFASTDPEKQSINPWNTKPVVSEGD